MIIKDWKKDFFTIPNMLSLFRLLLIPVYIVIYLNAGEDITRYYIAGGILAVSCLTDMVDGQIARHFNMISTIGKILDPFADKMTQFALILCLVIRYTVLIPLVVLFFVKELFQLIAGIFTLRKGKMLTGALITGKVSTAILFVSLIVLVMFPDINPMAVTIIAWVDFALLAIAFLHYAITYFTHGKMIQKLDSTEDEKE